MLDIIYLTYKKAEEGRFSYTKSTLFNYWRNDLSNLHFYKITS
nr:hypothetical protein [Mycoplasmopsis bovis]